MANVVTTLRILEAVGASQPVGVSDLARTLGLPKTSVQRGLETLGSAGWLRQSERGSWSLTMKVAVVGHQAGNELGIRDLALSYMTRLRQDTGESVRLWIPDGDNVVLVETLESPQSVRAVSVVGSTIAMHASSAGKAILAAFPDDELEMRLPATLGAYTPRTITDRDELLRALAEIRRRGYAVSNRETHPDVGGVAAAITATGRPIAALGVVLPMHRVNARMVKSHGSLVSAAARELSHVLDTR
jgi:IclR family acetate operon transcriptional repressor